MLLTQLIRTVLTAARSTRHMHQVAIGIAYKVSIKNRDTLEQSLRDDIAIIENQDIADKICNGQNYTNERLTSLPNTLILSIHNQDLTPDEKLQRLTIVDRIADTLKLLRQLDLSQETSLINGMSPTHTGLIQALDPLPSKFFKSR